MDFSKFFSNRFVRGASATTAILFNTGSYGVSALPKGCKDFFERVCCCCIACWRYFCCDPNMVTKRDIAFYVPKKSSEDNWKYTDLSRVESKKSYEMENVDVYKESDVVKVSLASLFRYVNPKNLSEKNKISFLIMFSDFVKKNKENIKVNENKFRGSVNDLISFCDISIKAEKVNSAKFVSFFNDLKFFEIELSDSANLVKNVNDIYKALSQNGLKQKGSDFIQVSDFY